jgi:hypothetical protein
MRGLSSRFMGDLKNNNGVLFPLLCAVKNDSGLCLQIRENYINIYYRGGSIMKVSSEGVRLYRPTFNEKYLTALLNQVLDQTPEVLESQQDSCMWVSVFPSLKYAMDLWFGKHPKDEREFQQLIVRENNIGKCARKTDYFICDIEYANSEGRFDLIAACWPSRGSERKKANNIGLAFIEMKYADGALRGESGMSGHIKGMINFLGNPERLKLIKREMKTVFNQMKKLDLIDVGKEMVSFNDEKPEFIFVLANHDPDSKVLQREIKGIEEEIAGNLPFNLKFAVSNFMGYGLYSQNMYGLNAFQERFKEQI